MKNFYQVGNTWIDLSAVVLVESGYVPMKRAENGDMVADADNPARGGVRLVLSSGASIELEPKPGAVLMSMLKRDAKFIRGGSEAEEPTS